MVTSIVACLRVKSTIARSIELQASRLYTFSSLRKPSEKQVYSQRSIKSVYVRPAPRPSVKGGDSV